MLRTVLILSLTALVLILSASCLFGAGWQWPSSMDIGGYSVTGIRGETNADGSGSATGMLQISGVGGQKISLTRSARGDITGVSSLSGRMSGVDLQGNLALGGSGLQGAGKVSLGGLGMSAKFSGTNGSLSFVGSAPVRKQEDTPLAVYTFDGGINLQGGPGRITITASGHVQRTGKLANQVTDYNVSGVQVNCSDGRGTVNVGGVSVTFRFF